MAIFDSTPADSEARKLGALRIRELKAKLETILSQTFSDTAPGYLLKSSIIDTDQLVTVPDLVAGEYNTITLDVKGRAVSARNVAYKEAGEVEPVITGGTGLATTPAAGEMLHGTGSGYELRKIGLGLTTRDLDYPSPGTKYLLGEANRRVEFSTAGAAYWQAPHSGLVRVTAIGGGGRGGNSTGGSAGGTGVGYIEVTIGSWYLITCGAGGGTSLGTTIGGTSQFELTTGSAGDFQPVGAPLVYGTGGSPTVPGMGFPISIPGGNGTESNSGYYRKIGGASSVAPGGVWYPSSQSYVIVAAGIGAGGALMLTGTSPYLQVTSAPGGSGKVMIEW